MAGLSLFLVLVVAAVGWAVLRDDTYVAPTPARPTAAIEPGEAAAALQHLEQAVRDRDPEAAARLAPDGDREAAALLRAVVDNAGAVGVDRFTLRYVDVLGGVDGEGRWAATVETAWLIGWAPHASQQQPLRPGSAKARLADALKTSEVKLKRDETS